MSHLRVHPAVLLALATAPPAIAQELLPDGGFELGAVAACTTGTLPDTWFQIGNGDGADTYSFDCATLEGADPGLFSNFASLPAAADGLRFAAAWALIDEPIGTTLAASLVAGATYRLRGSFAKGDWRSASDGYDVYLSTGRDVGGWLLGSLGIDVAAGVWTADSFEFVAPDDPAAIHLILAPRGDRDSYTAIDALSLERIGAFSDYGTGLAGSGGFVPHLEGSGAATPGGAVDLTVTDGLGGAWGLFAIGLAPASLPAFGGTLLVDPRLFVPHSLGGAPGIAGAGTITLHSLLPDDDALIGWSVYFQALYLDPNAVRGVSLTQGLEMSIG